MNRGFGFALCDNLFDVGSADMSQSVGQIFNYPEGGFGIRFNFSTEIAVRVKLGQQGRRFVGGGFLAGALLRHQEIPLH